MAPGWGLCSFGIVGSKQSNTLRFLSGFQTSLEMEKVEPLSKDTKERGGMGITIVLGWLPF